jgi:hypothetical protein
MKLTVALDNHTLLLRQLDGSLLVRPECVALALSRQLLWEMDP